MCSLWQQKRKESFECGCALLNNGRKRRKKHVPVCRSLGLKSVHEHSPTYGTFCDGNIFLPHPPTPLFLTFVVFLLLLLGLLFFFTVYCQSVFFVEFCLHF